MIVVAILRHIYFHLQFLICNSNSNFIISASSFISFILFAFMQGWIQMVELGGGGQLDGLGDGSPPVGSRPDARGGAYGGKDF